MTRTIKCQANRRSGFWLAHIPQHGVYGQGATLKALRESLQQGLALLGLTARVVLMPATPELEQLRAAEDAYSKALRKAVVALARQQATTTDIAAATGAPLSRVKQYVPKPLP